MKTTLQIVAGLAFFACLVILSTGCQGTQDPFSAVLRAKPVIVAGHININYPESRPLIVAGSAGSQVALEAGDSPVNTMDNVSIDQGKEIDIGAMATLLNDIQRSSAAATPTSAQRQSTATGTGTTGDVTAPSTIDVPVSIPVNITPGSGTTLPTP